MSERAHDPMTTPRATPSPSWTTRSPRCASATCIGRCGSCRAPRARSCRSTAERVISLSSNDYLGLTHHPRLREAALAAVREFGVGSGAVRTIAGTMAMHEALEDELAEFKGTPAVLTFQSGFTANTGVIPTITGETDLIVSDALNHASIIDGMRLSKAPRKVFPHADVAALRAILEEAVATGRDGHGEPYRLILVVTDGVFSMDGDIAPLPGIVDGRRGRGRRGLRRRRPRQRRARAATAAGRSTTSASTDGSPSRSGRSARPSAAWAATSPDPWPCARSSTQRARPFLFSTSHPPAVVAACREAIRVMQEEPELLERLWANTRRFKAELARLGFDTGRSETPITPVMMGDPETAMRFSDRLMGEGVFAQPVVFPTVALDQARLRTIVTAAHADDQLDRALEAFSTVGRELGIISG